MSLFSFLFGKKKYPPLPDIVSELEVLGYFRYADESDLEKLKTELKVSFEKHRILETELDSKLLQYKDYRFYFCDGEALFEDGGIEDYLTRVKKGFEKRGLKLVWEEDFTEHSDSEFTHTIKVNGKKYILFDGTPGMDCWGIAQLRFYSLLNDQLDIQQSDEKVFPISSGEDGRFVILSPALAPLVLKWFYNGPDVNVYNRIYPLSEWSRVHGLKL